MKNLAFITVIWYSRREVYNAVAESNRFYDVSKTAMRVILSEGNHDDEGKIIFQNNFFKITLP